jgi:hypothetical protein
MRRKTAIRGVYGNRDGTRPAAATGDLYPQSLSYAAGKTEEGIRRMVGTGKSVRFYPSERLRISQKYAAYNEKSAAF